MARLIKRYESRKLYDTEESRYVSLDELAEWIRAGAEVQVVDNASGADVSAQTLTQIILDEGRRGTAFLPTELLHELVRAGQRAVETGVEQVRAQVDRFFQASIDRLGPVRRAREEMDRLRNRLEELESLAHPPRRGSARETHRPARGSARRGLHQRASRAARGARRERRHDPHRDPAEPARDAHAAHPLRQRRRDARPQGLAGRSGRRRDRRGDRDGHVPDPGHQGQEVPHLLAGRGGEGGRDGPPPAQKVGREVGSLVEDQVAGVLGRLGVASRREVQELTRRVETLADSLR